jgi:hypothetical protein
LRIVEEVRKAATLVIWIGAGVAAAGSR